MSQTTRRGCWTKFLLQSYTIYFQGKYEEADPLCRRALAINEAVLGPQHPRVASALNNWAELSKAQVGAQGNDFGKARTNWHDFVVWATLLGHSTCC